MLAWVRRRHRSSELRLRFVTDTIDALDLLHRRVAQIEEQLREQQATMRELESQTARDEAEPSVVRLEIRDLIKQYSGLHETYDPGRTGSDTTPEAEQPSELLESLMPILTPIRSKRATLGPQAGDSSPSDEGREHVCLLPTCDGYELLERPGGAPMVGTVVDHGEGLLGEVVKVGRSPLPNDKRRCAYLLQAVAAAAVEEDVLSPVLASSG